MLKFRGSTTLYALDVICMVLAVSLIGFSLYILPYVLGYERYDVPEFIVTVSHWYQTHHSLGGFLIMLGVISPFFIAGIAFIFVSRIITFYLELHESEPGVPHIDEGEYAEHVAKPNRPKRKLGGATVGVILLMVGILVLLGLLEYYVVISVF